MLIKIIILSLLVGKIINLTTLTSNNCPTDFNPANYNSSLGNGSGVVSSLYANAFKP